VYSRSLDALRYNQRKRNELQSYAFNKTEVEEESFDNSDLKKLLIKQIDSLPKQQQVVLKLFYVEEYSLKETAELLEIAVGTAKSRLFHAREKLKITLKKYKT
jgi:RNA polymerase sigma-70 factor (ECF subfamily)